MQEYPIKSEAVIAHIRQANRGDVLLENTHPFIRQLWGRNWTYAHNGQLEGYKKLPVGHYRPIGKTDSEWVFFWILYQLAEKYPKKPTNWLTVYRFIAKLADQLKLMGVLNMLISDGQYMVAYCSADLHWLTRKAPFGKAKLLDNDIEIDFQQHMQTTDIVSVIATKPLTGNENWHRIQPGSFVLFHFGKRIL